MTGQESIQLEDPGVVAAFLPEPEGPLPEVPEETINKHINTWRGLGVSDPFAPRELRRRVAYLRMAWLWLTAQFRSDLRVLGEFLDLRRETGDTDVLSPVWDKVGRSLLACDEMGFLDVLDQLSSLLPGRRLEDSFLAALTDHFRATGYFRTRALQAHLAGRGLPVGEPAAIEVAGEPPVPKSEDDADLGLTPDAAVAHRVMEGLERILAREVPQYEPYDLINELAREDPHLKTEFQGEKPKEVLLAGAVKSHALIIVKKGEGSRFRHYPCPVEKPLEVLLKELGTAQWYVIHKQDKKVFPEEAVGQGPHSRRLRRLSAATVG
jgi:hypothetical protein